MTELPCPRCGTLTEGRFCKACQRELYALVRGVKTSMILCCASCERIKIEGSWKDMTLEDAIRRSLQRSLDIADEAAVDEVRFDVPEMVRKPGIKDEVEIQVGIRGTHAEVDGTIEENHVVPLQYEVTLCLSCRKRQSEYYEGVLQIRNERAGVRQAIQDILHARKAHVTKTVPAESGTDYYISDSRTVKYLAEQLHKEFGGEIKIAAQHFSEDKQAGKILYRTNALIVIPDYRKGDIVARDDIPYRVLGVSDKVKAQNLQTGETVTFPYKRGSESVLPQIAAQAITSHEVLHPDTYQPVRVHDALEDMTPGETVTIVLYAGKAYLVR